MDRKADFEDVISWVEDTSGTTDKNKTEIKRRIKIGSTGLGGSIND